MKTQKSEVTSPLSMSMAELVIDTKSPDCQSSALCMRSWPGTEDSLKQPRDKFSVYPKTFPFLINSAPCTSRMKPWGSKTWQLKVGGWGSLLDKLADSTSYRSCQDAQIYCYAFLSTVGALQLHKTSSVLEGLTVQYRQIPQRLKTSICSEETQLGECRRALGENIVRFSRSG